MFHDDDASTPLTDEEREGLIPSYITLRHELNEAEQVNIAAAMQWTKSRRHNVLERAFLSELHRRMFGNVWEWAGHYRTTARNIGVDVHQITTEVHNVVDDARIWVEYETYSPDEIAVRYSHRLVAIHPFPNGNGRFSRLVGDLLAGQLSRPPFTWGRESLVAVGEARARYVEALRGADSQDIAPLLRFARS